MDSKELLDITQATELVQALEARGDFKYKGIFNIFNIILDWTNRFPQNRVLVSLDHLFNESSIPEERTRDYILELVGKGHSRAVCVYYFPVVEYMAGPEPGLISQIVFCRPLKSESNSPRRYIQTYIEKCEQVIQKWIQNRSPHIDLEQFFARIDAGRLRDTNAGAELSRLLAWDLDKSPEEKKATYDRFAKPLIQKLIDQKQLLFLQNPATGYRTILFPRKEDLSSRIEGLIAYFQQRIDTSVPGYDQGLQAIGQYFQGKKPDQFSGPQAAVVDEIQLILPLLDKLDREELEKKKKEDISKALKDLGAIPRVVSLERFKKWSEELQRSVRSSSVVLSCEFPRDGRVHTFLLHQDMLAEAIKAARDLFDRKGDEIEVNILSSMGVDRYLDDEQRKAFEELEQRVLFNHLPWFTRIWRALFGGGKLSKEEAAKLKQKVQAEKDSSKLRIQTSEARQKQKQLATERMRGGSESGETETAGPPAAKSTAPPAAENPQVAEKSKEELVSEEAEKKKAEDTLRKIIQELDRLWDKRELPNRSNILEILPDFSEDDLIMFLKKYGRKEILSFRISHDKPKYVWPILISRRYIKQKGKKLLSEAMAEADKQRSASMPNQEKFDVSTAIEDFLTRIQNKVG